MNKPRTICPERFSLRTSILTVDFFNERHFLSAHRVRLRQGRPRHFVRRFVPVRRQKVRRFVTRAAVQRFVAFDGGARERVHDQLLRRRLRDAERFSERDDQHRVFCRIFFGRRRELDVVDKFDAPRASNDGPTYRDAKFELPILEFKCFQR